MIVNKTPLDRLFDDSIPEPNSGCWLWDQYVGKNGYGSISYKNKNTMVHRLAYECVHGPIPKGYGMHIDHICRVRSCCNPDHLRLVSCRENLLCGETHAARNASKTHCHRGHEFDGVNNKIKSDRNGRTKRVCMVCENINQRARRAARAS